MFNKYELGNTKSKIKFIAWVALFVVLMFTLMQLSRTGMVTLGGKFHLGGVISALELIVAIRITLLNYQTGGRVALILLSISILNPMIASVKTGDISGIPGICYVASSMVAVILIRNGLKKEEQVSNKDYLTGIDNRRSVLNYLNHLCKENKNFDLLYVDIDHFKYVNDTEGHERADYILQKIVHNWQSIVIPGGLLARLAGDEFLVIVPQENEMGSSEIASLYLDALRNWNEDTEEKFSLYITASIGIASFPQDASNADELIRKADLAMFKAKDGGRNSFLHYESHLDELVLREQEVEHVLRKALKEDSFYMMFQPQYEVATKKLRGFESLIRMDRSAGESIGPGEFIPIAEKTSLIIEIGEIALRKALFNFANVVLQNPELTISVNISARQLLARDFCETVRDILEETGFPAKNLEFEITEYCLVDSTNYVLEVIDELKRMGIQLAMDDFGTGYSSLGYLTKLPIDIVKIDKSILDTAEDTAVLKTIIDMGHNLGCRVVAEGAEQTEQIDVLKDLRCDFVQGYIWGKPMVFEDAKNLI